jgi:hypothetical protein
MQSNIEVIAAQYQEPPWPNTGQQVDLTVTTPSSLVRPMLNLTNCSF